MRHITYSASILTMRTTAVLLAAVALALPVAAQTPKPVNPAAKAAPAISDAQKAAYWKASALQEVHQTNADIQSKQDTAAVQQAVQAMVKTCGLDADLQQDPNGDPVCVLKPAEKK